MRHAPFFGWVHDLSAPDPTTVFNLFGLLPYDPTAVLPHFLHIGVWPLIMCATMVIQQRLNPKPADEIQAAVMNWMPFIFLFMFSGFAVGLVIYWAWNNVLSILQQLYINSRLKKKGLK
jgi:YidC/Oxa1 family membrane protein insertase